MIKKEKILQWLKTENVYEKFYHNFKVDNCLLILAPDEYLIENAFTFSKTPEGKEFWEAINDKYKKWYRDEFIDNILTADDFDAEENLYAFSFFKDSEEYCREVTIRAKTMKEAINIFREKFPSLYYSNIHVM